MKAQKLVLFTLFLVLIGSTIGCSSNSKSDNSPSQSASTTASTNKEAVELQFWDMVWGPPEYIETAQKLVEQFNQEHPDIKVNYQSTPWNNWYQTFATAVASGTAPDISTGACYQNFQFYPQDAILPLDDVIEQLKQEGKLDDFTPNSIESMKYDGHYLGVPWGTDTRIIYYRKDMFEQAGIQPPKNLDELRTAAKALTKEGKYGLVLGAGSGNVGWQTYLSLMLSNGGGLFTADRKTNMMDARNVEAAQFLSNLAKDGSISKASIGYSDDDARASFGKGDAALILEGPNLKENLSDIKDKIEILDPLEGPHGDKGTIGWFNSLMIFKQTKHPEQAKQFLKWWSDNNKTLFTEGHAGIPARVSFTQDPYFTNNATLTKIIKDYMPIIKSSGNKAEGYFPELNEVEGDGFLRTAVQVMISGQDGTSALEKANGEFKKVMKEN